MLKALEKCIVDVAGKTVAERVMEGSQQIARATDKKKIAEWVKSAIERLDSSVDENVRVQIMESCGRNCAEVHKGMMNRARARRNRYKNESEFLEAEQRTPTKGTRLLREGNMLYQVYTPRAFSRPMRCLLQYAERPTG
jgi:hypothetical protein